MIRLTEERPVAPPRPAGPRAGPLGRLRSSLAATEFQRHVAVLSGGTLASQAVQVVGLLLLARLYTPSAFGDWALLLGVALLAGAVGGLRYELAIVLPDDDEEALQVAAVHLISTAGSALLLAGVLFVPPPGFLGALGLGHLSGWLFVVPLMAFLTGLHQAATYWLLRTRQFRGLAQYRVAQAVTGVAVPAAAFLLWGDGVAGLAVGGLIGQAPLGWVLWRQMRLGHGARLVPALRGGSLWRMARAYDQYPKYSLPYALVGVGRERVILVLLAGFATPHVVGLYSQALRLVNTPVSLVTGSINSVLFSRAAGEPDVVRLAGLVHRTLSTLVLATPAFVLLAWGATDLVRFALGERWAEAGTYAALLAAPAYTFLLSGVLDRMLDVARRQHVALALEVGYTAAALAALVGGLTLGGPVQGVALFAGVTVVYHLAWIALVYHVCRFPWGGLARTALRAVLLAAGTALALATASLLLPPAGVLALGCVGLLGYAAVAAARLARSGPAAGEVVGAA